MLHYNALHWSLHCTGHYNALNWSLHCTVLQFIQFSASYYWTDSTLRLTFSRESPGYLANGRKYPGFINLWIFGHCWCSWVKWVAGNLKLIFTLGNWATIGHWFMNRQWWMIRRQLCPHWPKQALYKSTYYTNTKSMKISLKIQIQKEMEIEKQFCAMLNADWSKPARWPTMSWLNVAKSINQQHMQMPPTLTLSSSQSSILFQYFSFTEKPNIVNGCRRVITKISLFWEENLKICAESSLEVAAVAQWCDMISNVAHF